MKKVQTPEFLCLCIEVQALLCLSVDLPLKLGYHCLKPTSLTRHSTIADGVGGCAVPPVVTPAWSCPECASWIL